MTTRDMPRWTRWQALAFAVVLVLAAVLRLGWAGVNSFAFDEARLSLISLDMARGGVFATIGMPSSAGVPNLPAAAGFMRCPMRSRPIRYWRRCSRACWAWRRWR